MTRKSVYCLLLYLAPLTILPGCLQSSPFRTKAVEEPKEWTIEQVVIVPNGEVKPRRTTEGFSTASAREENAPAPVKLLEAPPVKPPIQPVQVKVDSPAPPQPDPRQRRDGIPGMAVTIDLDPEPAPKGTGYQIVPALPPLGDNKSVEAPLSKALEAMLKGRHQEALQHLRGYDDETQEFFIRLLPPLTVFAQKPMGKLSSQEIAVVYEQLDGLREYLRRRSALVISKMCYCKQIKGYANLVPLPDNHAFLTATERGPGDRVQLYVELKNFASEQTKDKDYVTKLACSLELKDAKNEKVWSYTFDRSDTTHRLSARMNDYHGNYTFYVPPLPAGTYQLTVQIVDETIPDHFRLAQKSLDFRVTPIANQPPLR